MSVDDLVEMALRVLRETEEDANTLVLFMSDNGFMWGEHGWVGKWVPYTESVRIPMYLRWPGRIAPGTEDSRIVANIDVAPTVLDAVGLGTDPDHPMDGRSLLDTSWTRDRLLLEAWIDRNHPTTWAMLRAPTYQYAEYYDNNLTPTFLEQYDLVGDPWQLENLLGDETSSNDPPPQSLAGFSVRLAQDRECEGTTGARSCP